MGFADKDGNYITAEMSRLLAKIAQTLSEENRVKLMREYDTAKNDSDLEHWVKKFPLPSD